MKGLCCLALALAAALLAVASPAAGSDMVGKAPAKAVSGNQNRAVLLCRYSDSPSASTKTKAHFEGLFSLLADYYDETSYGSIDLTYTVYDWQSMGQPRSAYGTAPGDGVAMDETSLARDCTDAHEGAVDFAQVDGVDVVLDEDDGFDATGLGGVDCQISPDDLSKCWPVTWIPAEEAQEDGNGLALWAHEVGHSFGLAHSSAPWWDPMSFPCSSSFNSGGATRDTTYGCMPVHYSAAQRSDYAVKLDGFPDPIHYGLDWIPDARTTTVKPRKKQSVKLERVADPGDSGELIAIAPVKGSQPKTWLTAEARVGVDGDPFEPPESLPGDGVVIFKVFPGCEYGQPPCEFDYLPTQVVGGNVFDNPEQGVFVPGEKFKEDGVTIKVVSAIGDHGFKIKVTNKS